MMALDDLQVRRQAPVDNWPWYDQVVFVINGLSHLDLLARATTRQDWLGPPPSVVVPPSDHLFGGPDRWEDSNDPWFADNMVAVAACNCGQPGCEAVLMKVTAWDDVVIWDNFEWYLSTRRPLHRVGPFTFDRTRYEIALRSIGHA
jgi:hypothetical protein